MRSAGNGFHPFSQAHSRAPSLHARAGGIKRERDGSYFIILTHFSQFSSPFQQLPALGVISSFQQLPIQPEIRENSLSISFQQPCREVSVSYSLFQFPSLFDVDGNVCFHFQLEMLCLHVYMMMR